jgi:hypothetical protein
MVLLYNELNRMNRSKLFKKYLLHDKRDVKNGKKTYYYYLTHSRLKIIQIYKIQLIVNALSIKFANKKLTTKSKLERAKRLKTLSTTQKNK